jgi:hypothetical protein
MTPLAIVSGVIILLYDIIVNGGNRSALQLHESKINRNRILILPSRAFTWSLSRYSYRFIHDLPDYQEFVLLICIVSTGQGPYSRY